MLKRVVMDPRCSLRLSRCAPSLWFTASHSPAPAAKSCLSSWEISPPPVSVSFHPLTLHLPPRPTRLSHTLHLLSLWLCLCWSSSRLSFPVPLSSTSSLRWCKSTWVCLRPSACLLCFFTPVSSVVPFCKHRKITGIITKARTRLQPSDSNSV